MNHRERERADGPEKMEQGLPPQLCPVLCLCGADLNPI